MIYLISVLVFLYLGIGAGVLYECRWGRNYPEPWKVAIPVTVAWPFMYLMAVGRRLV